MYQIPETQLAVKYSPFERKELQEYTEAIQENMDTVITNGNQIVFNMLTKLKSLEIKVKPLEIKLETAETNLITAENKVKSLEIELETLRNQSETKVESNQNQGENDLQPIFELIRESLYGAEEEDSSTNEELLNDVLGVLSEEPPKPQTIEKVVEKEIERSLSADEVLLKLSENKMKILNAMATRRNLKGKSKQLETFAELIDGLAFNKGAILDWGDCFPTFLKRSDFKDYSNSKKAQ